MMTVPVAGNNGVPADATAALVSVTAVEPCADTFLTCSHAAPRCRRHRWSTQDALSIVANSAVMRLGHGALCIYSMRATDVLVDVSGWIGPTGLRSTPVSPVRLVDTRPGQQQALQSAQNRLGRRPVADRRRRRVARRRSHSHSCDGQRDCRRPGGQRFRQRAPRAVRQRGPAADNVEPQRHDGRDVAASATVALGDGELCIFSSTATDVVVDLQALHGDDRAAR